VARQHATLFLLPTVSVLLPIPRAKSVDCD